MSREDFKTFENGQKFLLTGDLLNKYGRAAQAVSQGRGGHNAHSLNTTIKSDAPESPPIQGLFVIRASGTSGCGSGTDGDVGAPCVEPSSGAEIKGRYLGAFRYWDTSLNRWLEYDEEMQLDASGYFEGYDEGFTYHTEASWSARGPGYGPIPRYYAGEVVAAWYDPQRGWCVPITGSLPQDEVHVEYRHKRDVTGSVRVPEFLPSGFPASARVVAQLHTTATTTAAATEVVDSLHWVTFADECYGMDPGDASTGTPDPPGWKDTRSGFTTLTVEHGDAVWIDIVRTEEPTGNMYVEDATIRLTAMGRVTPAEAASNRNFGQDVLSAARDIRGWHLRSRTQGRHSDAPSFCPTGATYNCPDAAAASFNHEKIFVALRDQNQKYVIQVEWKITVVFEPDAGGLSSTSMVPEESTSTWVLESSTSDQFSISSSSSSSLSSLNSSSSTINQSTSTVNESTSTQGESTSSPSSSSSTWALNSSSSSSIVAQNSSSSSSWSSLNSSSSTSQIEQSTSTFTESLGSIPK